MLRTKSRIDGTGLIRLGGYRNGDLGCMGASILQYRVDYGS